MSSRAQLNRLIRLTPIGVILPPFPEIFRGFKNRSDKERRESISRSEGEVAEWVKSAQTEINRTLVEREGLAVAGPSLSRDTIDALRGSKGVPGNTNRYVTQGDLNDIVQQIGDQILNIINSIPVITYAAAGNYSGIGDPNGVVFAFRGANYQEFTDGYSGYLRTWIKRDDGGNTGWV